MISFVSFTYLYDWSINVDVDNLSKISRRSSSLLILKDFLLAHRVK